MIRILYTLLISCLAISTFAQTSFTEASDKLANQFVNSGAAIGVADMNGDGLDDIIRLHRTTQLVIEHQTTSGNFENILTGIETPQSNWSLCIDDLDRNGKNDVFLGSANAPHGIVWSDASGKDFEWQQLDGPPILPQGANFADIDNDGDSDLFICNDNGSNFIYRNDGGQVMSYNPEMAPTDTAIESDNSGNYASIWVDYDNDDDLDLYISKCRLGILDVNDPRRVNMLWENDGNGNYTEVAVQRGLVPYAQTWSTDFADIDNDGDLDVFMINHDTTSRLYENDGTGHFTDITSSAGFSPAIDNITVGLQAQFADFDGDTYVDLVITSSQGGYKYFRNNGNKTFGVIFGAFQTLDPMHSIALGDLNNDGFMDVVAGFGMFYNSPTFIGDKLFLNDGNANNWSKIKLKGTNSNINGVGSRLEAHGPWGIMIREVRSGVGYGINSTLTAHFGLGAATSMDSLVIKWPSGYRQVIENPDINQTLLIEEGGCLSPPPTYLEETICQGETTVFNGEVISDAGIYSTDIYLPEGCDSTIVLDLKVNEVYNIQNSFSVCAGSTYTFPDGSFQVIDGDMQHISSFTSVNDCDSIIMTSLNVLPVYSNSTNVTVCEGSTYTWPDGTSSVILDAQSQTSILSSQFNCDSIIVTSVNVTTAPNSQFFDEVCAGESYTFPDGFTEIINEEFIYEITFNTGQSCDSTASYIITALENYEIVDSDQACLGGDYTFPDGTTFAGLTTSFSWTSHLTASTGCDSTVLINLEVLDVIEISEFIEVCQGENYIFPDGNSQVISQDIIYDSFLQSANGCDSIIITNVIAKQSYEFTLQETICSGDDYTFPDGSTQIGITESLCHNSVFTTFDGCDSIIITKLSIIAPVTGVQDILICQGDNFIFPDGSIATNITEDMEQESTIEASNTCDSIVTSFITVSPSYNEDLNYGICSGESIQIGDLVLENIVSDTSFTTNDLTIVGCDSIFNYNINVENINPEVTLSGATATALALDVNYQWIDCNTNEEIAGATQQNYTPEQDGDYAVIMEGFACLVQSECVNVIVTSTEDKQFSSSIELFPNPTGDKLHLNFRRDHREIQASIYDVHGKLVHNFLSNQNQIEVNVDFLAPGVYVTRFETEGKYAVKKFVKL